MPDDSNTALDLGAIIRERDTFRDELERAKARIKELNGESAGRRLNEERLGKIADERAAALEAARADAEKALQAARDEWAGKLTAAEQAAAERDASHHWGRRAVDAPTPRDAWAAPEGDPYA